MSAKHRMLEYLDKKGISQYNFSKETGLSNGFLKSGSSISSENLELISKVCIDLNLIWLINGEGDMIKRVSLPYKQLDEVKLVGEAGAHCSKIEKTLPSKPHYENLEYSTRPFIDACFGALGVPNGFAIAVKADECEHISIPFISNYDFSIKGRGDSMINRKKPDRSICDGDLIACRIWTSRTHIQWGQVYALATSEGVIIKQLRKSEKAGYVKCVSFNEEDGYAPYEIPVSEIYDWALVVSVTHTAKW